MQKQIHLFIFLTTMVSFVWIKESTAQGWQPATNLGPNINTSWLEDGHSITTDSSKLYLSSDRPGGQGVADIWVSEYIGAWQEPVNLGTNINSSNHEYEPCISSDGTKLYFSSDRLGGYGGFDIYVSEYVGGIWQPAINLGPNINTSSIEACPNISADGLKLYFVSDRTGGYGERDIWCSEYSGGSWQTPINLGDSINTSDDEYTPCLANDGLKLYFASTRTGGYGSFDIWQSEYIGGAWQSPTNLGPNINTNSIEVAPFISSNSMKLYFAAYNWPGGYGDCDIWVSEYHTNIEEELVRRPLSERNDISLSCFPNPVCSHLNISYSIPKANQVCVNIYDLVGKKIRTLVDCRAVPGQYATKWFIDNNLPTGTYFCCLKYGNIIKIEKILLIR